MTTTVHWGVLSTAAIARDHVIPAIQATSGSTVLAIASRRHDRARASADAHGIPVALGSYEALCEHPDVDCIYIATPNSRHVQWTLHALAAGKAVLVEKSLTPDPAEVQSIAEAAAKARQPVAEAFMYRYHKQFDWLRRTVEDGVLGQVRVIRGAIGFAIGPEANVRLDAELGGGALLDVGCYPLDAMCLLYGAAPVAARAMGWGAGGVDHVCSALLEFPGHRLGVMDCSFQIPWLQAPLEVAGDRGLIRLVNAYNPGRSRSTATLAVLGAEPITIEFAGMDMYEAMIASFAESWRTRTPPTFGLDRSQHTAAALGAVRDALNRARFAD